MNAKTDIAGANVASSQISDRIFQAVAGDLPARQNF
jgi:hypothetical protein